MTCVVSSSAWQPFTPTYGWSPMNPDDTNTQSQSGIDRPQYGYASSESESRQMSVSSSGKKRASRAGTRSVTTLSAAQLERKRANDREAQRAIRQRTKDHIDSLERNINDLRAANDASEKMVAVTHQRNRELEDENAYLRGKLGEVGYPTAVPPDHRAPDPNMLSVHSASPAVQAVGASIPRPDSTGTPRSNLSINTSQSSNSRQGSWQQASSTAYSVTVASAPASIPAHSSVQLGPGLTSWRSHDSAASPHASSTGLQDHQLVQQQQYQTSVPTERAPWPVNTSYPYTAEQHRASSVPQSSPQPQVQYAQATPIPTYVPTQQPQSYVTPPQNEFQSMSVHSPSNYQQPQPQHTYAPPQQHSPYQITAIPPAPTSHSDFVTQAQMQPPHMQTSAAAAYQDEKQYNQQQQRLQHQHQQQQQSMTGYRDDAGRGAAGFSLTHYPSG